MSDGSAVLVFARAARAEGRLKSLGRGDAATGNSAATLLLEHALAVAGATGADTIVAGDEEIVGSGLAGARLLRQRGSDFGERFRNAVAEAFALGYRRVVAVGTDTPGLTPDLCRDALRALAAGDARTVVLGPARDGGYYLIGFNAFDDRAFRGIPWKTRLVLARTRRALTGCRIVYLPTLTDADDEGSLVRALGEAPSVESLVALRRVLSRALRVALRCSSPAIRSTLLAALIPVRRGPPLWSFGS